MATHKVLQMENSKTARNDFTSEADSLRKQDAQKRMRELEVLQGELKSMKKGGRVYKQQPNSHIFFKQGMEQVFSEARREMDDLVQEYKDIERREEEGRTEGASQDG